MEDGIAKTLDVLGKKITELECSLFCARKAEERAQAEIDRLKQTLSGQRVGYADNE